MALYYRVLGLVAALNSVLECITLYHIRLNWMVLCMLVLISAGGGELLGNPQSSGMLESLQAPPLLLLIAPLVVLGLFVVCIMKRNLIFRATTSIVTDGSTPLGGSEEGRGYLAPQVSGWFHRGGTVLRPEWLANGIYAILRANDPHHDHPHAPDATLTSGRLGPIYTGFGTREGERNRNRSDRSLS